MRKNVSANGTLIWGSAALDLTPYLDFGNEKVEKRGGKRLVRLGGKIVSGVGKMDAPG